MSKLKEFILKELGRDEKLKKLWEMSIGKQSGAITRYLHENLSKEPDWLRKFFLRDIGKAESDADRLGFIEAHIKVNLLERIKKHFPEPVSNEEFEISYLEAKEDYIGKKKDIEDGAIRGRTQVALPQPKKLKPEEMEYARMWTNQTGMKGELIDKENFNGLEKNKSDYQIFVIDRGEFERNSIGQVYFGSKPKGKENRNEKRGKKSKNKIKRDMSATHYKLLFHALKNDCCAGDIFTVLRQCFPEEKPLDYKSWVKFYENEKTDFWMRTSTFRKSIAELSNLLNEKIGVRMQSRRNKIYRLIPIPSFCLIQII